MEMGCELPLGLLLTVAVEDSGTCVGTACLEVVDDNLEHGIELILRLHHALGPFLRRADYPMGDLRTLMRLLLDELGVSEERLFCFHSLLECLVVEAFGTVEAPAVLALALDEVLRMVGAHAVYDPPVLGPDEAAPLLLGTVGIMAGEGPVDVFVVFRPEEERIS